MESLGELKHALFCPGKRNVLFRLTSASQKRACLSSLLGSLSTRVFETRTATGREHFACQDSGVS